MLPKEAAHQDEKLEDEIQRLLLCTLYPPLCLQMPLYFVCQTQHGQNHKKIDDKTTQGGIITPLKGDRATPFGVIRIP